MNKSMMTGALLGAAIATAGGTLAGYNYLKKEPEIASPEVVVPAVVQPQFAQVTGVTPVQETQSTPRQSCKDVTITHRRPVQDQNRIVGSAIGALAGGLLGNQVGGGNGKKLATVAGAVGGGYAGNQVQKNMQSKDTYTTTEQRCTTVYDKQDKVVGYNVSYMLGNQPGMVRMNHQPGPQIPVKDGQLVLREAETAPAPMAPPAAAPMPASVPVQ